MNKKLKPQEKVERFVVAPSTHLFMGVTVTKDTDISDKIDLPNNAGTVYQTIKDLTLTTYVRRKEIDSYGIDTKEDTKLVQKLPEGIVLIWGEDTGYIIPTYKMRKVEDAIEDLKSIEEF